MNIVEGDILVCATGVGHFTPNFTYLVRSHNPGSTDRGSLFITDDFGRKQLIYASQNTLYPNVENHFVVKPRSAFKPPPIQLITDSLVIGDVVVHTHTNQGQVLLVFTHVDTNTGLYHFTESTTNIHSCFPKDWVNKFCTYANPPTAYNPFTLPPLPQGNPFLTVPNGPIVYKGPEPEFIKSPPRVHKECRQCGKPGNHNVVNHKEYYYCTFCKDEC